ncbi:peptidase C45 [Pseudomonas fluorescens HK44]|uniref:Peptidase C45 n=1 Tax=Pseudomonas fluorescens HK44 TaxID=1042209 RepID=A0A010SJH2_PSEFL|nr:C45 family peptidase [Pseudomonas fluorescens]EXF93205.1 peptidase C45 [Pseudomonas fluorescens HK44]
MSHSPFPLVEISGPPFERGIQYGQAVSQRIHNSIEIYSVQLLKMGYTWADIRAFANEFVPSIEAFEPEYAQEMRGIAEGAGCDFEAIVLINARTEIIQLGRRKARLPDPDGCTGAVILPTASAANEVIHGQNWDWRAECAESAIVLKVLREDGPDVLTFTEAGGLARNGLNSIGTAITANYLESERDYTQVGVPLPFIRRKALEAAHFALSIKVVATTAKSTSNNMMLSHAGGYAINFECAPDEVFPIQAEQGLLVHANHWQSPVALGKLREAGLNSVPESLYRDVRVRQILSETPGQLTAEHLKQAFFDDFGTPWAVCRPPLSNMAGNLSATVAMVVMRPAKGLMEVAPLPAVNREFTTYSLAMEGDINRYLK